MSFDGFCQFCWMILIFFICCVNCVKNDMYLQVELMFVESWLFIYDVVVFVIMFYGYDKVVQQQVVLVVIIVF